MKLEYLRKPIKHAILCTMSVFSLFTATLALPAQVKANTWEVTETVYIRTDSNMDAEVIDAVEKGTKFTVKGTDGNWYKVSNSKVTGYIYKKYLREIIPPPTTAAKKETQPAAANNKAPAKPAVVITYVNTDGVNLRAKPTTKANVKGSLVQGQRVIVVKKGKTWTHVMLGDKTEGYVRNDLLGKIKVDSSMSRKETINAYRETAIAYAKSRLGNTYSQKKRDKAGYADCSSLMRDAFEEAAEIYIGDNTVSQKKKMKKYRTPIKHVFDGVKRGDLVYHLTKEGTENHVGIYLGNGEVLHASKSAGKVIISSFTEKDTLWNYTCKAASFCYDSLKQEQKKAK